MITMLEPGYKQKATQAVHISDTKLSNNTEKQTECLPEKKTR